MGFGAGGGEQPFVFAVVQGSVLTVTDISVPRGPLAAVEGEGRIICSASVWCGWIYL